MDPFTILGAVVSALLTTKEVWETLQWMQKIYETYTDGDKFLQSIALECFIYGESIKAIGHWLRRNQTATTLTRQMRITHNAISLVQVSMASVLRDLNRFKDSPDVKSTKETRFSKQKQDIKLFQQFIKNKAKHQWFSETMGLHLIELRAHAATLHLTLGVIELAGKSPNHQEKEPGKLEAKTGNLEKRLMLRQFLVKALYIKRSEIAGLAAPGDQDQSPSTPPASSGYISPRKLTFYDVVQLARQQACVERTRRSNEDLIDLSDTPKSPLQPPASSSFQRELTLLDASSPTSFQHSSPDLSFPRPVEQHSPEERTNVQHAMAELDAAWPLNASTEDVIEVVELDASATGGSEQKVAGTRSQVPMQVYDPSETPNGKDVDQVQPGLGTVRTNILSTGRSDAKDATEICPSPAAVDLPGPAQQPSTALDNPTDENSERKSVVSNSAPSTLSHTSSSTGATACSLPGITEEDMQARLSSSLGSQSHPKKLGPSTYQAQKIPAVSGYPKNMLGIEEVLSHPPQIRSEGSVSLPRAQPQLLHIDEPDENGFPWIVQAARDGDEAIIRKLLVSQADIQASHTSTQRHALAEASIQGHTKIVDLLIEEGCSLEQADAEGNTALHHACQQGHLAVVKSLITHNASVEVLGSEGRSALHLAMEAPTHQNVVMLLIQHKANVNARDASSRTPLHISAHQGNLAMCSYLLNEGALLDAREAQSKTPLHVACEAGHYELVQMMLDRSQLRRTETSFLAAFFAAVEYGHVRVAESFFSRGLKLQDLKRDHHKPLTLAAKSGYQAMVELMVHKGCKVNVRDDNGWNALHFASHHGHYQIIEELLTNGVSAKATTSRKETPLLLAVKGSHFPVVERLLRTGNHSSLVNAEDERGQQPVHHAVRAGSLETFNLLMSNGGKFSEENVFGWQPLHIAAAYGHSTLVDCLLQRGANIEEKLGSSPIKKDQTHKIVQEGYWAEARWPYPGSRALHLACEYGHEKTATFLISKGAKMEASCSEGWRPLHHATFFGSSALVETLLQGGVDPHAMTNEGKTASSLGFCTGGSPIAEEETERIRNLLREPMDQAKKQKKFKAGLKKASTVEDKNNLVRTAAFSMMVVSRPHMQKAKSTTPTSRGASASPDLSSSSHRPRLQHLPYTSPLPSTEIPPDSASQLPSDPSILPTSQSEVKLPAVSSTPELSRKCTDKAAPSTNVLVSSSTTSIALPSSDDTTDAPAAVPEETQALAQTSPMLRRRTTFGLSKGKPGAESSKFRFASIGKPTVEIGTWTLELGKQSIDMTRQGLDLGKKGFEAIQEQGLEVGKQSRDMTKKGVDMSKQGYLTAKRFAQKGKLGSAAKGEKKIKGDGTSEGSREGGKGAENGAEHHHEEEDVESDDARSVFTLGEFDGLGKIDSNKRQGK
ncbi:MAG: hypothetical protein Q9193_005023 [Seirophora villosa]